MPNRLAGERSAYLRGAAEQPVDWLPWGPEAFERARREDKPILLDVGAMWCHWCHVLDRESYEDPETARLVNDLFVPVKVDRDERPDVDARYQLAVQALAGQGGWPLTAFLTPEGKPFFGGTYFPPEDKWGRPGFRTVLERVAQHYRERREDALAHAEQLHQELARRTSRTRPGELSPALLDRAAEAMLREFDLVNGGFGTAPKFPHPAAVEFLLARHARTRDASLATLVRGTLDGMARGGIHDHLLGGFHRYAVDAEWIVPHFEKMLYDNAGLLRNYSQAWLVFREPAFRATAEGIVAWLRELVAAPEGGFRGSQDADVSLDDDGDHWTWTLDELRAAVPDADLRSLLAEHFDVGERGEMQHDPRRNVLFVARTAEQLAKEHGLPVKMVEERLAQGKALLLAARQKRPLPLVDPSVYVSWSAMAAGACLEAWKALGDPWLREHALRTLDRLLREAYRPGKGMAHVLRDGKGEVWGLLEDQAWMASALLDAYEVAGEPRFLEAAEAILGLVLEHWRDPADGALWDSAPALQEGGGYGLLAARRKPLEDAPAASPGSIAAMALDKLAALKGEPRWREASQGILKAFAGSAAGMGVFAGSYFLALAKHLEAPAECVIVGEPSDARARALHEAALRVFNPWLVVHPPARDGFVPEAARAALQGGLAKEGPVALVCRGARCEAPVRRPEELATLLERFGA